MKYACSTHIRILFTIVELESNIARIMTQVKPAEQTRITYNFYQATQH